MARTSKEPLKPNPFFTYRDPETGVWRVIADNNTVASANIHTNSPSTTSKSA
ncbi:MAG: hypothetical protein AB4041_21655 [Microcystaceae cyanobacterium]